jgi:uncharacterized RDD family membrane protein YckC
VLASSLPEAVARSIVEHRVGRRVLAELREEIDPAELEAAANEAARRVVESPAFREVLVDVLRSPELRGVLTETAGGYGDELATALRAETATWDERLHLGAADPRYGGVVSRGIALVLDAAIVQLGFVVSIAAVALVASLAGAGGSPGAAVVVGLADSLVVVAYFAGFWSVLGQTPAMRLLGLRVTTTAGGVPSLPRALLRAVVLLVSIAVAFLGFAPALAGRRSRALPDLVAGTVVARS